MVDLLESFIMTSNEFKNFLKILNIFSGMCNDLDVVDGKVFQRTNDRVAAIRCDLSNLIKFDGKLTFCDIKKIAQNLKALKKNSPIRFKRSGNGILVKDTTTSVFIPSGNQVYCDNKNISEVEFDTIFKPGQMLLESELDENLCESLKKYAKITSSDRLTLSIQSQKAVLRYGEINDNGISPEFNFNYKLVENIEDFKINLPIVPFNLKSVTTLTIYFDQNSVGNNKIVYSVFNIPFNENITFEFYNRTAIIKKEEED
jgi:hypothetical protein